MEYTSSSEESTDKDHPPTSGREAARRQDKYDYEKFKKVKWVTDGMGSYFSRNMFLIVHARATIFYFIFVICVTIAALGIVEDRMFFMSQSIRARLKEQAGKDHPTHNKTSGVEFDDISTVEEMWDFLDAHLTVHSHAKPFVGEFELPKDEKDITTTPIPLGEDSGNKPKLWKRRKRDTPKKESPENENPENKNPKNENPKNEAPEISPYIDEEYLFDRGLGHENILVGQAVIRAVMVNSSECPRPFASFYKKCYPPYGYHTRRMVTSEGLYVYQAAEETNAECFTGKVSHYYGGGFQESLGTSYNESQNITGFLRNNRFVTKATRAVFVDATYYNPSVNLFCAVKFLFELPAGGGVVPSSYFYTLKLTRVTVRDYIGYGFQIIFLIFIIFYIAEDIRTISFIRMEYFSSFWNWVNLSIYATSIAYFSYVIKQNRDIHELIKLMRKDLKQYISFQTVTKNELLKRDFLSSTIFFVYLKIFKYVSFNWTMTILNKTIEKCLRDVFAFVFMFLVMFMAFALFGALCFGTQMLHFSSVPLAMFALLRTMLGDFDYDEFTDADRFVAPCYYLLYIFSVFLVLLNMFLAIINDTYSDAKTELTISPPERRIVDFWSTGLYNLMKACGCKKCAPKALVTGPRVNPSVEEIREALKRCGYSNLDIDLFLGRYNIDPQAQVRVKDVTKLIEQLRSQGLKRHLPKINTPSDTYQPPIIAVDDFTEQQRRLDKVEGIMGALSEKLDDLLEKLDLIDSEK